MFRNTGRLFRLYVLSVFNNIARYPLCVQYLLLRSGCRSGHACMVTGAQEHYGKLRNVSLREQVN